MSKELKEYLCKRIAEDVSKIKADGKDGSDIAKVFHMQLCRGRIYGYYDVMEHIGEDKEMVALFLANTKTTEGVEDFINAIIEMIKR